MSGSGGLRVSRSPLLSSLSSVATAFRISEPILPSESPSVTFTSPSSIIFFSPPGVSWMFSTTVTKPLPVAA
eukprot:1202437-Alexandrium_andersonii.AAC.1